MNPEDHGQGPSRLDFSRLFGRLTKKKDKDDVERQPLRGDEELSGPAAPPYTPREGGNGFGRDPGYLIYIPYNQLPRWMTNPGGNPEQAPDTKIEDRGRKWKTILKWLAFVLAIWALIHLFVANSGEKDDDYPKDGPGSGSGSGPGDHHEDKGPSHGGPPHEGTDSDPARYYGDGKAVKCAIYDDWVTWQPHDHGAQSGYKRYSTNTSFSVPVRDDIFAHLAGPAGVGSVVVSSHDSEKDTADVIVETVIEVANGKQVVDSSAWQYLQASNVCLMSKDEDNSGDLTKGEDFGVRDGIGIYTARPDNADEYSHLSFRVYLSLPAAKYKDTELSKEAREAIEELARQFPELQIDTTLAGAWLDAINDVLLGKSGIQVLEGLVKQRPSLHVDSPIGSIHLGDLSAIPLGHVGIKSDVGSYTFEHVKADNIRVWGSGSGSCHGTVEVSNSLDVDISSGSINLDVSLTKASGVDTPYHVKLHSNSGSIQLRYKDWADPNRALVEDVTTNVGSIHLRPHPVYQGNFHFFTSVGSINIHVPDSPIPDPLGRGRERHLEIERQKGMFPKVVDGKVSWTRGKDDHDEKGREEGKMDAKTQSGSINVEF